jgi:hypothetical protein
MFLDWDLTSSSVLFLNFQGATSSAGDRIVISYQLDGSQLVRSNSSSGVTTTIAGRVTGYSVAQDPNNANQAIIEITFAYRTFTATYTLTGVSPS